MYQVIPRLSRKFMLWIGESIIGWHLFTRQVASLTSASGDHLAKKAGVILIYPGPTTQLTDKAKEFIRQTTLPQNFTLFTDPDYTFTNACGLRWNAPNETAYPSTFVVAMNGIVRFAVASKSHSGRSETHHAVASLK